MNTIYYFLILGVTIGLLANFIDPRRGHGGVGAPILGVVGTLIGIFIANFIFNISDINIFNLPLLSLSLLGAISLLLLSWSLKGNSSSNATL